MERNVTEFALGPYRLSVDVEATQNWYHVHGEAAGGCDCAYCRNFSAAVEALPPEVGAFLTRLGLDLRKPEDASECGPADGGRLYLPIYHLAGRLLERGAGPLTLAPGVTAWFTTDQGPFPRNFPEPFFQCCLELRLPWVLEEPEPEK